jgi:hypothetical protein
VNAAASPNLTYRGGILIALSPSNRRTNALARRRQFVSSGNA